MHQKTSKIAGIGLITAIVIVLQFMGSFIHFGIFSISLVLIPIVVGASVYDYRAGAWLGLVFGVVVLLSGDAALFLAVNVPGTVLVVLAKGILAGLGAGLVYAALSKSGNRLIPVVAAAAACPVINTGVFLIGGRLFFYDTISSWAAAAGYDNVLLYMIVGFVGFNFLFEFLANVILSPIIVRIINIGKKMA